VGTEIHKEHLPLSLKMKCVGSGIGLNMSAGFKEGDHKTQGESVK
jgi:hypothetical protein